MQWFLKRYAWFVLSLVVIGLLLGNATNIAMRIIGILAMLGLVLLLVAVAIAEHRQRMLPIRRQLENLRRQLPPKCGMCGYDLRASKGRCPECGTAIPLPVLAQTPMVHRILDKSRIVAAESGADYVGTEHLLLALLTEPEGVAFTILDAWGINEARVREEIRSVVASRLAEIASKDNDAPQQPA